MTTAADVIAVARRDLGYKESPPGSNRNKFGAWYGMDAAPWCAMAVSCWFYTAGLALPFTTPKGFAYCPYGVSGFKAGHHWTETGSGPFYPGDVVFLGKHGGAAYHVGIVTATRAQSVIAISGNSGHGAQANGGEVVEDEWGLSIIQGVGRPVFTGAPAAIPPPAAAGAPVPPLHRMFGLSSPLTRGDDVRVWQARMRDDWRYQLGVDGIYGGQSAGACADFQRKQHLVADAVVGPVTWARCFSG